ncbi:hypothetical protein V6N13_146416 [Hibiscus sabdariffa]|uniref:Uncharacterized protein n=1 Tax=Hibiscus sabdariffa TaxID=183260 RepID=A0ABR2TTC3_9ROSI
MRCKKHLTDLSSGVGVCATCLRERLLVLLAAQTRIERAIAAASSAAENRRQHEPPPLVFPRSVSPYVSRRKSDDDGATWFHQKRFYSTPQVDLTTTTVDFDVASTCFKKKHRFSLFSRLFGTRSEKYSSDPRVHHHREPCDEQSSSSSSSPSWFSSIFTAGRKSQQSSRTSRVEYCSQIGRRDRRSCIDRGTSPAIEWNRGDECDQSQLETSPEVSRRWKRTPTAAGKAKTGPRNQKTELAADMTFTIRSESRPPKAPQSQCGGILSE